MRYFRFDFLEETSFLFGISSLATLPDALPELSPSSISVRLTGSESFEPSPSPCTSFILRRLRLFILFFTLVLKFFAFLTSSFKVSSIIKISAISETSFLYHRGSWASFGDLAYLRHKKSFLTLSFSKSVSELLGKRLQIRVVVYLWVFHLLAWLIYRVWADLHHYSYHMS